MKKDSPTLGDIVEEVGTEGYFERAHERAQRRKSPWNLMLIPLVFGFTGLITYILFQMMWRVHVIIYPAHIDRLGEFWQDGASASSLISSALLLIPLFFASLPVSMILANMILWHVPPARQAFESEAKGVKWASFGEAMSGLFAISRILVPICLLLSFIGAATLTNHASHSWSAHLEVVAVFEK